METGSKIEKLVIGARDLKDHLGRYLVQGLVVSVFLHSAMITLVGLWPSETPKEPGKIIVLQNPPVHPIREKQPPSEPNHPKPKPPNKPNVEKFVPVEEPLVDTTIVVPPDDVVDMTWSKPSDGTVDTGATGGDVLGGVDTAIDASGISGPIFIPREIEPLPLEMNPQPSYPEMAREASIAGVVHVWVHISDRGDVIGWQVIDVKPAGLGFEDEVARVIPKWKFTPAIQQNNPVAVWVAIPFKFRVTK